METYGDRCPRSNVGARVRAPADSDQKVTCRIPFAGSLEAAASALSSKAREKKIRFHESPWGLFIFPASSHIQIAQCERIASKSCAYYPWQ